jgi:hypothetical protein
MVFAEFLGDAEDLKSEFSSGRNDDSSSSCGFSTLISIEREVYDSKRETYRFWV